MSNTYKDLQNSHPCFGGHKNNSGRIHLPVSPGCNIACRFCDRVINDEEERPGVTSKVITPGESVDILKKALEKEDGISRPLFSWEGFCGTMKKILPQARRE